MREWPCEASRACIEFPAWWRLPGQLPIRAWVQLRAVISGGGLQRSLSLCRSVQCRSVQCVMLILITTLSSPRSLLQAHLSLSSKLSTDSHPPPSTPTLTLTPHSDSLSDSPLSSWALSLALLSDSVPRRSCVCLAAETSVVLEGFWMCLQGKTRIGGGGAGNGTGFHCRHVVR